MPRQLLPRASRRGENVAIPSCRFDDRHHAAADATLMSPNGAVRDKNVANGSVSCSAVDVQSRIIRAPMNNRNWLLMLFSTSSGSSKNVRR
jgi:hypothetical protein